MRFSSRLLRGVFLAAFLGWIGLQSFHSHADFTQSDAQCHVCKIAHQAPALLGSAQSLFTTFIAVRTHRKAALQPALGVVFTTHGLAPPLL